MNGRISIFLWVRHFLEGIPQVQVARQVVAVDTAVRELDIRVTALRAPGALAIVDHGTAAHAVAVPAVAPHDVI